MARSKPTRPDPGDTLYTGVDDDQFDDLAELTGQQVVHAGLWQDSMATALTPQDSLEAQDAPAHAHNAVAESADDAVFDLDLYLRDGVYFELYGVQLYPSLDSEPLSGYDAAQQHLRALIDSGLWLDEIGVDEDDSLVLILCRRRDPLLYVPAGAWVVDEWDELPDDTTGDPSEHNPTGDNAAEDDPDADSNTRA